jgi:hypothetical protein
MEIFLISLVAFAILILFAPRVLAWIILTPAVAVALFFIPIFTRG